jgi:hypothetical protein
MFITNIPLLRKQNGFLGEGYVVVSAVQTAQTFRATAIHLYLTTTRLERCDKAIEFLLQSR